MDSLASLRHFLAAADAGSFSRAAEACDVKVSTISRHIAALETELGAALFNRSTRHLHLTEAGTLFYEKCRLILAELEQARQDVSRFNATPQGLLRVAMPVTLGHLKIMPAMPAFLAAHPQIRLEAILTATAIDPIEAGYDAVIRTGLFPDSALVMKRLADAPTTLVASPALAATYADASPEDLETLPTLCHTGPGSDRWPCRTPAGIRRDLTPIPLLKTNDLETLRQAARDSLGPAILPEWLIAPDLATGKLVRLFSSWQWGASAEGTPAIALLYPPKKTFPPKLKVFSAFLTALLHKT
ncbi:LysR family transcriptional regulator [Acetobacter oeni]|uniref:LysR family transcriptional regulator n=2 Tax=Acetobacter oeni TaxID=304077 RepID=A0A511XH95_9PROT|nr:LysR family transcriptional regulator [Acetobacter oeni]GBR06217.1 LysR family transcriptional regulator [Acetobacter oeni LMG 21952]GEN62312.1 LysR family transcriptional regulator [Acetobacter oeni]